MSRFGKEIRLIPWVAWLIALVVFGGLASLILFLVILKDPHAMLWPWIAKIAMVTLPPLPLTVYVLLCGYVNRDAKRRGMRHALWTCLAVFIPNGIGIIIYFILRDPLLQPCPSCGSLTKASFAFCPRCAAPLSAACRHCKRAVEPGWAACPYCGTKL
jgi:hypothetical protein